MQKKLHFEQLRFYQKNGKTFSIFLGYFSFPLELEKRRIAYHINNGILVIQEKDEKKVLGMISQGISQLISMIDDKPTVYVTKEKEIPLVGTSFFGIVDRDTNIIEVKPITGCNINCIFCSVDEGTLSKKQNHFLVEAEYLAQETSKLARKKTHPVHVYINTHGEPTLYQDLPYLLSLLRQEKKIKNISLITNGTLLTEKNLTSWIHAGLNHLNVSLNAWSPEKSTELAGRPYPVERVKVMITLAAEKIPVIVSPVFLPGINEKEIEQIVRWVKQLQNQGKKIYLGIQNFLPYKRGRNPIKPLPFPLFLQHLKKWEEKYSIALINPQIPIQIIEDPVLEKPYAVGETIEVEVKAMGRYPGTYLAVTDKRSLIVQRKHMNIGKRTRVIITKNKHNIYYAK